MVKLDVPFIFDKLGGPIGVLRHIKEHWLDADLNYATVQMWLQRDAISATWQASILYLMHEVAGVDPMLCIWDERDLKMFREHT